MSARPGALASIGLLLVAAGGLAVFFANRDSLRLNSLVLGSLFVICIGLLLILWFLPKLQVQNLRLSRGDAFTPEIESRKLIIQLVGGAAFLATFYVSWANYNISRDKEVTEEFTKAIELLQKDKQPAIRIGATYSLERLAKFSPQDYDQVITVLAQAVRDHAATGSASDDLVIQKKWKYGVIPRTSDDITILLKVLSRRTKPSTGENDRLDLEGADLTALQATKLNLRWAYLNDSDLRAASCIGCRFEHAELMGVDASAVDVPRSTVTQKTGENAPYETRAASFTCSSFAGAVLGDSKFQQASFLHTDLANANLAGGHFEGALFNDANLTGANLKDAHLEGADLSLAIGVTPLQIASAHIDNTTRMPARVLAVTDWQSNKVCK